MERSMREAPAVTAEHLVLLRARRRARGFTLVELTIVVAIVAVLAVIALVGYRKYILAAKVTEGKGVISAIRIAQEDHRAERGTYVDVGTGYCPASAGVSNQKVAWDRTCGSSTVKWAELPVHVDGPVQFQYGTTANNTTAFSGTPFGTSWVTWGSPTQVPWYVVAGRCDLDGDSATPSTQLVSSSFQNTIFVANEGQ